MAKFLHLQSDRIIKTEPWGQYELSDTDEADEVLDVKVEGDEHPRLRILADGTINQGNGAVTPTPYVPATTRQLLDTDVRAYRSAANTLTIDDGAGGNVKTSTGSGTDVAHWTASITGQLAEWKQGTSGDPLTARGPTIKVSRTQQITRATIEASPASAGTAGEDQLAAIMGINKALDGDETQPVGVGGFAYNASTTNPGGSGSHPDACGIVGEGRITGSGVGVGIGGFFLGRRDATTGKANGIEVHCQNLGAASAYTSTGFSDSVGIWLNCSGAADSASGITVSNAFGRQFENGLSFTAQVASALTGGVRERAICDDSSAVTSYAVRGSHTTGIDFHEGAFSSAMMRLKNDALVKGRNAANSADVELFRYNAFNEFQISTSARFLGVAVSFSAGAQLRPSTTGAGLKIGGATTELIGFWNATAIVQPTTAVAAATFVANAGTAVNDASTFDGYTLGKVVKALRNMGLLA